MHRPACEAQILSACLLAGAGMSNGALTTTAPSSHLRVSIPRSSLGQPAVCLPLQQERHSTVCPCYGLSLAQQTCSPHAAKASCITLWLVRAVCAAQDPRQPPSSAAVPAASAAQLAPSRPAASAEQPAQSARAPAASQQLRSPSLSAAAAGAHQSASQQPAGASTWPRDGSGLRVQASIRHASTAQQQPAHSAHTEPAGLKPQGLSAAAAAATNQSSSWQPSVYRANRWAAKLKMLTGQAALTQPAGGQLQEPSAAAAHQSSSQPPAVPSARPRDAEAAQREAQQAHSRPAASAEQPATSARVQPWRPKARQTVRAPSSATLLCCLCQILCLCCEPGPPQLSSRHTAHMRRLRRGIQRPGRWCAACLCSTGLLPLLGLCR